MRGHIRKRKNSYAIVIDVGRDPATGKRKQQWVSVKGTKKDAERKLSEMLNQLDNGTFIKPSKSTFADFLEVWLRDYVNQLAPRTAEGYEYILRCHVIPSLGNVNLVQLKPEHLQKYYSSKIENGRADGKGGLSRRTMRHHHMVIHKALSCAVK